MLFQNIDNSRLGLSEFASLGFTGFDRNQTNAALEFCFDKLTAGMLLDLQKPILLEFSCKFGCL